MSRPLHKRELIRALQRISELSHAAKSDDVWEKIGGIRFWANHALGIDEPSPQIEAPKVTP